MVTFSFYATYRGLDPKVSRFLRGQAQQNAQIAIGIDVLIFRPAVASRPLSLSYTFLSWFINTLRDFGWYCKEVLRGHIIFPAPAIIHIIFAFKRLMHQVPVPELPLSTAAELYKINWPSAALAPEIMATYLRFVAAEDELYGLRPFDHRYVTLWRYSQIYSNILGWLFRWFKPSAYMSIYSGYIHHYIPCLQASEAGAPILLLGCTDCLYRISDLGVPRQFVHMKEQPLHKDKIYEQIAEKGGRILQQRLEGQVDYAIQYMRQSPFKALDSKAFWNIQQVSECLFEFTPSSEESPESSSQGQFIVVFMHELQDWHHNGVLPTFASSYYEWLLVTVRYLSENQLPFTVKVHPAICSEPYKYMQSIKALCGLRHLIGAKLPVSTVTNTLELVRMGMALGLTVRGTIGIELAYIGMPFLCAGKPPYGLLFPRRCELRLRQYLYRIHNFRQEPKISMEEVTRASYYVGLQDRAIRKPEVSIMQKCIKVGPEEDFVEIKKYL